MHEGPTDELNTIIHNALGEEEGRDIAYYRAVLDAWNNTALMLRERVVDFWPEFENDWATFVATGVAIVSPNHPNWVQLQRLDDQQVRAAAQYLAPADNTGRAFLNALLDWLDNCRAVDGVGIVTAQTIGPGMDDSEYA